MEAMQLKADQAAAKVAELQTRVKMHKEAAMRLQKLMDEAAEEARKLKEKLVSEADDTNSAMKTSGELLQAREKAVNATSKLKIAAAKVSNDTVKLEKANQAAAVVEKKAKDAALEYRAQEHVVKIEDAKAKKMAAKSAFPMEHKFEFAADAFCPPGSKRKTPNAKCEYEAFCPKGSTRKGNGCVARVQCPDGTKEGTGKGGLDSCVMKKVICPSGAVEKEIKIDGAITVVCQFPTKCPLGQQLNGTNCVPEMACPKGSKEMGALCVYPAFCPNGTVVDQTGQCKRLQQKISCPEGTVEGHDGQCYIIKAVCPKGTKNVAGLCYREDIRCPPTTTMIDGACVSQRVECPAGTRSTKNEEGAMVCVNDNCPAGTKAVGHKCEGTIMCPAGTVPDATSEGLCFKPSVCADNAKKVNGKCVLESVCERKEGILHNGKCLLPPTCPPGTSLIDGNCVYKMLVAPQVGESSPQGAHKTQGSVQMMDDVGAADTSMD